MAEGRTAMALNGFILTDVGAAMLSEAELSGDIV